jgi:hypothetical protein
MSMSMGCKAFCHGVPDWSVDRVAAPLGHMGGKTHYPADGILATSDNPSVVAGSLVLRGAELDVVAEVAPLHTDTLSVHLSDRNDKHGTSELRGVTEALRASRELAMSSSLTKDPYRHTAEPTPIEDVFTRLLIGDRTETEWPAPGSVRGLYNRWLMGMQVYERLIRMVEEEGEDGWISGR